MKIVLGVGISISLQINHFSHANSRNSDNNIDKTVTTDDIVITECSSVCHASHTSQQRKLENT